MPSSTPPPGTPPPRNPSPSIFCSPVSNVPLFYDIPIREEFVAFGYDDEQYNANAFDTQKEFIQFLNIGQTIAPKPRESTKFSLGNFFKAINEVAGVIWEKHFKNEMPLMVFKDTANQIPQGHVTDTKCRPDITAAFQGHWQGVNTTWPLIRLAGEDASKGKSKEEHKLQSVSYLHYLLLARPDLHVGQGMLISEDGVHFLLGVGGVGIWELAVGWESTNIYKLMYAFVYRLYEPGDFADTSYLHVEPDDETFVKYTIRITGTRGNGEGYTIDCPGFFPIYASSPFGTRTHVLSNPSSDVKVKGQPLMVLKDQLCRRGTRFDEWSILARIHGPEKVPGVVEAVHTETIDLPLAEERQKTRLGLRQSGNPFLSIPTAEKMLRTLFDVLEVLRFLRLERRILHRDISKGNILYIEQPHNPLPRVGPAPAMKGTQGESNCFIKCLLGESNDPEETSALVIDFNHAEDLENKQSSEHERKARTGTPLFIARAVELGMKVSLPKGLSEFPALPASPTLYTLRHPARTQKYKSENGVVLDSKKAKCYSTEWRHELEHDAESVFWLLLYWAIMVQPHGGAKESIRPNLWTGLVGNAKERNRLVRSLAQDSDDGFSDVTHSFFNPLLPLIEQLATFLVVDRHWLETSDERNQPEYVNEAFQRLILQFILDNRGQDFMKHPVDRRLRKVRRSPFAEKKSTTSLQIVNAEENRKRPSPEPSNEGSSKRRRHEDEYHRVPDENLD